MLVLVQQTAATTWRVFCYCCCCCASVWLSHSLVIGWLYVGVGVYLARFFEVSATSPAGGARKFSFLFFSIFFRYFLGFFCFLCCSVISVSCACRIQYHEHGNWGCRKTTHNEDKETTPQFNPFRTAVRFWGQTTQFSSRLSNKTGLRFQRG